MAIEKKHLDRAVSLAKSFGATRLILFGSAVNDPERARDIDFACDGIMGWKLYEFGAQLEEALLMPVDLIPLSPPSRLTRLIERRGRVLL
jgi:predicted nucleotidyltransferase